MIRDLRTSNSRSGTALVTGLMVMLMVSILGIAYISLTTTNLLRASRDERRTTAFYLAEAGLEHQIATIMDGGDVIGGTFDMTSILGSLRSGASGEVVVSGVSGGTATITSSATYRGVTERIEVVVVTRNVGIWNNAIFAGIGQAGRCINGNVDIRGSVHILGEGEPFTDINGNGGWDPAEPYTDSNGNGSFDSGEPFTDTDGNGVWSPAEPYMDRDGDGVYDPPLTVTELATSLSGDANIGNNYKNIPTDLKSKLPALVPQTFGGEWVETLNAELRVKHGRVDISGSASVGSPNATGNAIKETVDGCYVTDGYGGNKGSSSVYSDNGKTQKYDLGDRIPFPSLSDPYTDPDTHITYSSLENYLHANSLQVEKHIIDASTLSFSESDGSNSIAWDQSTNTLTIQGIIRIDGDLDLGAKATTVKFTTPGERGGTIYAEGDIRVHGSVMPVNTFPTVDTIGFIAEDDIDLATGSGESQIKAVGAWYAEGSVRSAKQSNFGGTYVANYFDMGTNVPSIFQVPELVNYLPPGMPGQESIFVAQVLSWRHLPQH